MKNAARITLGIVVVAAGLVVVPRSGPAISAAVAQVPTPLLSDLLGEPTPKESDDPTGGEGGGGGGGGGGGDKDGDGKDGDKTGKKGDGKKGDGDGRGGKGRNKRGGKGKNLIPPDGTPTIPGSFTTDELVAIAAHLRSLGWSAAEVVSGVYPPFIIAGEATWIDTWGVPRYGPGPIVRSHEGQDVFCDFGDPVLAPEPGTVSFGHGGLGGITARVHTADGAYWYLTHLSDLNTEELAPGDAVTTGTILGYCGNSGNARTTPPHVHFGWYQPNGKAKDPMRSLIRWLGEAEARAGNLVAQVEIERRRKLPTLTAQRRFGDAFAPDRSVVPGGAGESLWASGSRPATGAFALAEAALQAALAEQAYGFDGVIVPAGNEGAGTVGLLDPDSALAKLLERRLAISEAGD